LFQAQFCGGTLIDQQWILTAAHCFANNLPAKDFLALIGSTDLTEPTTQPIGISQVIVHSKYNAQSLYADIALLKLETAVSSPSALLTDTDLAEGEAVFAAGWGALNEGSATEQQVFPGSLMGVLLQAISGQTCNTGTPGYPGEVFDSNICAYVPGGGKDSCQGDSGGPLYSTRLQSDNSVQLTGVAGITSWGIGCANAQYPGVYTKVASFIGWIRDNTGVHINTVSSAGNDTPVGDEQAPDNGESPDNDQIPENPQTPDDLTPVDTNEMLVNTGSGSVFILGLVGIALCFRPTRHYFKLHTEG